MTTIIENPVKQQRGRPPTALTKFDGPPDSTKPKKQHQASEQKQKQEHRKGKQRSESIKKTCRHI